MSKVTDTIPRTHQLVPHARAQLIGMAEGHDTFEDCRVRYGSTQRQLELRNQGRTTVTRVPESDRNWAPTRDLLQEFARWGAIEESRLPSSRRFIDTYRTVRYPLTSLGHGLAEAAATSQRDFADQVTQMLLKVHPYFKNLLSALATRPIVVPVVGERDLQRFRGKGLGIDQVAQVLVDERGLGVESGVAAQELRRYWQRFRGRGPDDKPTTKELADATNKALLATCFAAAGAPVDSETIRTLLRWGEQLALYDQSRYVPAYLGSQTIWLCADVDGSADPPVVDRRGLAAHGEEVARAIVSAYEDQSRSADSQMDKPVLPIHLVRAQAACSQRVTRRLCDLVLSRMVDGEFPQLGVQPALFVGNTVPLPRSEPPFRHNNQRRLTLQINRKEES